MFAEFVNQYGMTILYTVLTAVASYIGLRLKALYEDKVQDKQKREIARTAVKAAEQMYHAMSGPEKLEKACDGASEMLAAKGITVTGMELRLLIEEVVAEFNYSFTGGAEEKILEGK